MRVEELPQADLRPVKPVSEWKFERGLWLKRMEEQPFPWIRPWPQPE